MRKQIIKYLTGNWYLKILLCKFSCTFAYPGLCLTTFRFSSSCFFLMYLELVYLLFLGGFALFRHNSKRNALIPHFKYFDIIRSFLDTWSRLWNTLQKVALLLFGRRKKEARKRKEGKEREKVKKITHLFQCLWKWPGKGPSIYSGADQPSPSPGHRP